MAAVAHAPVGDHAAPTTITTVGGLLPADLLAAIADGRDLPGLTADDYGLELGIGPREAANRAWAVLTGAWAAYRAALAQRPEEDPATALTREKWLLVLFRELGFGKLPATPAGGLSADDRSFPVSHHSGPVAAHLLGWGVDLDRRTPGVAGAAERAPHAMVQEFLNRSDDHQWAFLANGGTLRLLRDSSSLVGQSYVEFDLQAMFDGEAFSDFALLWLVCHHSRFQAPTVDGSPDDSWLERWRAHAADAGTRALGELRIGVKAAIEALGTGFVRHPANEALHARLRPDGDLTATDLHQSLLRLVYRLLFCFVAEDRGLLTIDGPAAETGRRRYADWFSTARLRRIAARRHGTSHSDLWQSLAVVFDGLGQEDGRPELALPGLGGLFEDGPADVTNGLALANDSLLQAVRHLSIIRPPGGGPRRAVDYRHLGAEELGGIYESLLEFVARHDPVARTFTLESLAGNDRKKTGAYYTPASLIDTLLTSALDPLLDRAERAADPEAALLAVTVCDPACGSGHFLVAAAKRIAHRLARVRAGDSEPTPAQAQSAMYDVVSACIYGVDLNPLAVELAKVSLWLEALQRGRPLTFLDAHIKVGNALLGSTPALLRAGLPDAAFTPLEGDDRKTVTSLKKRNKAERDAGQHDMFATESIFVSNIDLARRVVEIDLLPQSSLADIHEAQRRYRAADTSAELRRARLVADAWCAAFVAPKTPSAPVITDATLRRLAGLDAAALADDPAVELVDDLAARYRFFHWHLEFPTVFTVTDDGADGDGAGWSGGFSCVVGNPPWERIKLQEQEFFAARDPDIATAPNAAARKRLIADLAAQQPQLFDEFTAAKRRADGESHLIRQTGRFPLCGRGDVNTYAVFAETDRMLLEPDGRLGVILPTGIATDATTQYFFSDLVDRRTLVSLFDFENAAPLFEGVHRSFKFCLLTVAGGGEPVEAAEFAFFAHDAADLARPGVRFTLTPDEIRLLNPNTGTCPVFRTRRDAELTLAVYRHLPVLVRHGTTDGNPWGVSFMRMIDMSNDSGLFRTRDQLEADGWTLDGNTFHRGLDRMLPLYEGKLVHHYDHRWATYTANGSTRDLTESEHDDPTHVVHPRYWVNAKEVDASVGERWDRQWFAGFRDICRSTDERTMIAAVLPRAAVGNNLPILMAARHPLWQLVSALSSHALDYVARLCVGGTHMNFFIAEQLPVLPPSAFAEQSQWDGAMTIAEWIRPRVLELTYTAADMAPFAADLGDTGAPFRWDPDRRAALRAELDGAFFHLHGFQDHDDVDYVLGAFPIVNEKDRKRFAEERTRRLVLDAYDRLATAISSGQPFQSTLEPPPGHGPRHPA